MDQCTVEISKVSFNFFLNCADDFKTKCIIFIFI